MWRCLRAQTMAPAWQRPEVLHVGVESVLLGGDEDHQVQHEGVGCTEETHDGGNIASDARLRQRRARVCAHVCARARVCARPSRRFDNGPTIQCVN